MPTSFQCIPGCHRWDYQTALQQSQTLVPFADYTFNLEASFNDLQACEAYAAAKLTLIPPRTQLLFQYEYVKEVYTTSVPGFMSQIGGKSVELQYPTAFTRQMGIFQTILDTLLSKPDAFEIKVNSFEIKTFVFQTKLEIVKGP